MPDICILGENPYLEFSIKKELSQKSNLTFSFPNRWKNTEVRDWLIVFTPYRQCFSHVTTATIRFMIAYGILKFPWWPSRAYSSSKSSKTVFCMSRALCLNGKRKESYGEIRRHEERICMHSPSNGIKNHSNLNDTMFAWVVKFLYFQMVRRLTQNAKQVGISVNFHPRTIKIFVQHF